MKAKTLICFVPMALIFLFTVACQTSYTETPKPSETMATKNETDLDYIESASKKMEFDIYEGPVRFEEVVEEPKQDNMEIAILEKDYWEGGEEYWNAVYKIVPTLDSKTAENIIRNTNKNVVAAMKDRDLFEVQKYIHPLKGVRITCYNTVSTLDIVLSNSSLLLAQKYDWYAWASGEIVSISFRELFDTFLWNRDYTHYTPIYNPTRSPEYYADGNEYITNEYVFYNNCISVLYYYEGNYEWARVDWQGLKLIYQEHSDGNWYLTGIIHCEREL
jgi:hypothetical protein